MNGEKKFLPLSAARELVYSGRGDAMIDGRVLVSADFIVSLGYDEVAEAINLPAIVQT